jgi:hypothetical protein
MSGRDDEELEAIKHRKMVELQKSIASNAAMYNIREPINLTVHPHIYVYTTSIYCYLMRVFGCVNILYYLLISGLHGVGPAE